MAIIEILVSIIELFKVNVDPDKDVKELVKAIQRASEFSARFTRIHLYQLQRQLQDLKQLVLLNSEQAHCEVVAGRVLALHHGILQALQIVHRSLRRYLWGQPVQALLDLLVQTTKTCRLAPSTGNSQAAGRLFPDEIPTLCTELKNLINKYQSAVQDIVRENQYYESPRSYWKMKRKSRSHESIASDYPVSKTINTLRKHKQSDDCTPKVKETARHPKSFCSQNIGKVFHDQPQNHNENDERDPSDGGNDNKADKINISARLSEVELDKTSLQDEAEAPNTASATLADGGGDFAPAPHQSRQRAASPVRSRVQGSNVLLVCIEESCGLSGEGDIRGHGESLESGARCHADLDNDSVNLWRLIGRASDTIVEEMLQSCVKEMQLDDMLTHWLDEIGSHEQQDQERSFYTPC